MSRRFTIIDAKPWHVGRIARRLRIEHLRSAAMAGVDAHKELRACFDGSAFRKALFLDDTLIALGGVMGSLLSSTGYVWLAMTDEAAKHPVAIARLARAQLDALSDSHVELATTLLADDAAARRFAIFLGFHVGEDGPGQRAYSRAGRRRLDRYLDECDQRVPVGRAMAIAVGYHREAA